MVTRDSTGPKVARSVTSCSERLAWGITYAQGVCLACYGFATPAYGHQVGVCGACRCTVRLKKGYCRLCWHQALLDRDVLAADARSKVELAPYLPQVRHQQLFLAGVVRKRGRPRAFPRRYGVKGRPPKPPPPIASRPPTAGAQLTLFPSPPRTYRYGRFDGRSQQTPDNPWLAWALHLAHNLAETRGLKKAGLDALNRTMVMLLATHADGDTLRVSDFHHVVREKGHSLTLTIDLLAAMDVLDDDRPPVYETWLADKLTDLAPGIAAETRRWAHVLRNGTARRKPRPHAATSYINAARPALLLWSRTYEHLREVTRDDVLTVVNGLRGRHRQDTLSALRSLFGWAKRDGVIFQNPAARIRLGKHPRPVWQRLTDEEIIEAVQAARTPQAKLYLALATVHAARNSQIRAIRLDDVDLGNRRLTIAGRTRPLDDLTHRLLVHWLDHRRRRWPHTTNPHLLISRHSAVRLGPVSKTWILDLRCTSVNLERLRIDRQLEEAVAVGGDPLHLASVFGIGADTAIRYATNAQQLLEPDHDGPSDTLRTRASEPADPADEHSGSA